MDFKRFYKPSLMKIGTWILLAGFFNYLYSFLKSLNVIPCRIMTADPSWAMCAIDPTLREGTLYLGLGLFDALYLNFLWPVVIFFGLFILAIPYTLSSGVVEAYRYFMNK